MFNLHSLYFPASSPSAAPLASHRFNKWNRLFEAWVAHLQHTYPHDTVLVYHSAWKRLARFTSKMPWELAPPDIAALRDHLQRQGLSAITINAHLGHLSSFYRWLASHPPDNSIPLGFNPVLPVKRLPRRQLKPLAFWSQPEIDAFLAVLHRDTSPLGLRDCAFFSLRLVTGVPHRTLLHLTWGQLSFQADTVFVHWRPTSPPFLLPPHVWQALRTYLQVTGRWDALQPAKYLFVPLIQQGPLPADVPVEAWLEDRPLSQDVASQTLQLYARAVGIPLPHQNLRALRRTVIRRMLDSGAAPGAMLVFMDSQASLSELKFELKFIRDAPFLPCQPAPVLDFTAPPPDRKGHVLYRSKAFIHTDDRPPVSPSTALRGGLAENTSGMDHELDCLRLMLQGILERPCDHLHRLSAYSRIAARLSDLLSARDQASAAVEKEEARVSQFLAWSEQIERIMREEGSLPASSPDEPPAVLPAGGLSAEVASLRRLLQAVYDRSLSCHKGEHYLQLADHYSKGCVRLARLLRSAGAGSPALTARSIEQSIDQAIKQLTDEMVKQD